MNQQADETLQKSNQDYQNKFRTPLTQRSAFPQTLRFSTTTDFFSVLGLEAGTDQLAAATAPPELTEKNVHLVARIHQSLRNNVAATVLSGMILHEQTLQSVVTHLLGYLPDRLKPDEDREPWTIEFARQQPISGDLRRRRFHDGPAGGALFPRRPSLPGNEHHGRLQAEEGRRRLQGGLPGRLADLSAGVRPRPAQLSMREQAIRRLLERRMGKMLQAEMVAKGFTPKGRWASAGTLVPVEIDAQGGWLVIAGGGHRGEGGAADAGREDGLQPVAVRQGIVFRRVGWIERSEPHH